MGKISTYKEKLFSYIKEAAKSNELPSKMKCIFYTSILKKMANYYEVKDISNTFVITTVNVVFFDDTNADFPILIIGHNGKYQDFYYYDGWKILSAEDPEKTWKEKNINIQIPDYLVNNFSNGNLVEFFEDAVPLLTKNIK